MENQATYNYDRLSENEELELLQKEEDQKKIALEYQAQLNGRGEEY